MFRLIAFSDVDFKDLVNEYVTNDVPLDMLVMDMDWHITFYKEARKGMKGTTEFHLKKILTNLIF
jgi:hypothetical protein